LRGRVTDRTRAAATVRALLTNARGRSDAVVQQESAISITPPRRILVLAGLALALAGCAGDEPATGIKPPSAAAGPDAAEHEPRTGAADPASSGAASDPFPAPVDPGAYDNAGLARFDGYGAARFGMSADEVRQAWDGELDGIPGEGEACFHLSPAGQPSIAHFALMFGDGEFVRYSVEDDAMTAPGGGRRGMDEAAIERLYGERIERSNHKYVEGGEYLRIAAPDGGDTVLIFETDAHGTVTEWRVGRPPQVDYVEGCA
jgi:hypothetical protein